jgi:Endosomal/lysosomal potassium channel TMEM175
LPARLTPRAFSYTRIAGQSTERLAALSDGIFAVAMTLLVLDLHVPAAAAFADERALARALLELAPHLLIHFTGIAVTSKHDARFDRGAGLVTIHALRTERAARRKVGCRNQGELPADEEAVVLKGRSQGD